MGVGVFILNLRRVSTPSLNATSGKKLSMAPREGTVLRTISATGFLTVKVVTYSI
jgi:hypothetical protein